MSRGYSLIEMMLVVSVLGITAALAVPRITLMIERGHSSNELLKVQKTIEQARDTARETRRCVQVQRTAAAELSLITRTLTSAGACTATVESTAVATFNDRYVQIPAGLDLLFDRTGGLSGATTDFVELTLTARWGGVDRTRSYRVYSVLGLVRAL